MLTRHGQPYHSRDALFLNAPIEYDRQRNGHHYALTDEKIFELPGLWFSETELYALLATQQLLADVQSGLLDTQLKPVKERIEQILAVRHLGSEEISKRVRILAHDRAQCRAGAFPDRSGCIAAKK